MGGSNDMILRASLILLFQENKLSGPEGIIAHSCKIPWSQYSTYSVSDSDCICKIHPDNTAAIRSESHLVPY